MMNSLQFFWKLWVRLTNPSCKIRAHSLSRNVKFGKKVTVEFGSSVAAGRIGDFTFINKYCLIDKNVTSIGKFCSIAYNVRIGLGGHPTDWVSTHPFAYDKKYGIVAKSLSFEKEPAKTTVIGNDVWIGANSTILAGVKVGDGAIIGAHSLVTKDVEPYSIVVGTPAKHLRYRFKEDIVEQLRNLGWWDWDEKVLRKEVGSMDDPIALLKRKDQ